MAEGDITITQEQADGSLKAISSADASPWAEVLDKIATATPAANAIAKADESGKLDGWVTASLKLAAGSYVIAVPGDNLDTKYNEAAALTPGGNAKSATNRATLLIAPGTYTMTPGEGNAGITCDVQFVDIIGLGTRESVRIVSDGRTLVQTANDVTIANLTLVTTSTAVSEGTNADDAAYFPETALAAAKLTNVRMIGPLDNSMRTYTAYSGTYTDCVSEGAKGYAYGSTASGAFIRCTGGDDSFGSYGGTVSGVFQHCVAGDRSFGDLVSLVSGTFDYCVGEYGCFGGDGCSVTGTFRNCRAGDNSFGGSTSVITDGYFQDCVAGSYSFGSDSTNVGTFIRCVAADYSFSYLGWCTGLYIDCKADWAGFSSGGYANGTYINCVGGAGSFGGDYATAGGIFINCSAGEYSFGGGGSASGTFVNCTGTLAAFGGDGGGASGTFEHCTGGSLSFGNGGALTGKLYYCRLTSGSFETVSGSGVTRLCLSGTNVENNQG